MKKTTSLVFISLLLFCAVFAVVRYLQCVHSIDYATGFYYSNGGLLGSAIYILIIVALVYFLLLALFLKIKKAYFYKKRMKKIDSFEGTMLGVFMLACGAVYTHKAIVSALGNLDVFEILYLSVGALGFFLVGIMLPASGRITPAIGFTMALPGIMYILRAVNVFMHNLVIMNVSDNLIRLLIDLALGMIYFALGRVFSRSETPFSRMKISGLGLFVLTLIIGDAAGKVIYWVAEPDVLKHNITQAHIMLPTPVFMMDGAVLAALLFLLYKKPFKSKK